MNIIKLSATVVLGSVMAVAQAQQPQPAQQPAATQPTAQQYEQAIQQIDAQINAYMNKLDLVTKSMMDADASIEKRIDRMVDRLKKLQDSEDSGTRVSSVKEEVIQGLYNYVNFVVRERDQRVARYEGQPGSTLPRYGLKDEIGFMEGRIEKRAEQIIALANSFGVRSANVERFEYKDNDDDDYNNWRYGETYHGRNIHYSSGGGVVSGRQTTDEYRQMRDVANRGEMTKEKAIKSLEQSIANLKRKNNLLDQRQRYARNLAEMQYAQSEISKNRALIDKRQEQIYLLQTQAQPGTQTMARQQAVMLEEQIREEVTDLKMDFRAMLGQRPQRLQIKNYLDALYTRRAQYAAALQKLGGKPPPPPMPPKTAEEKK
jgi:hypothetical protein